MRFVSRLVAVALFLTALVAVGAAQETSRAYPPGDGVTAPTVVKDVKPAYTREAREKRIEGLVYLSAVVLEDGTVGDVKVTQSLDEKYGLDEQAIKAIKEWIFKPGAKDGKPVPVLVAIEMSFTLKK